MSYYPNQALRNDPEFQHFQALTERAYVSSRRHGLETDVDEFLDDSRAMKFFSYGDRARMDQLRDAYYARLPWAIGHENVDSTTSQTMLFDAPSVACKPEMNAGDLELLTGLTGYKIVDDGGKKLRKQFKDTDRSYLDKLVFLGVAGSFQARNLYLGGMTISKSDTAKTTEVEVGGDHNGDFYMMESILFDSTEVFDPTGRKQPFAPILETIVRGYHSIEQDITKQLLVHIAHGRQEELDQVKPQLLDRVASLDAGRGAGPFADYGHNNPFDDSYIVYDPRNLRSMSRLGYALPVYPGDFDTKLDVISAESSVIFRNQRGEEIFAEIEVPDEQVIDFIATMTAANAGRTSVKQLVDLIRDAKIYTIDEIDDIELR